MKIIFYAGAELLTGDEIAIGVLRFCEALAAAVVAEVIEIPIRDADGSLSRATLLVGPSSQILAKDVDSVLDDVIDPETMRRLALRIRAQQMIAGTGDQGGDDRLHASRWEEDF